MEKRYYWLKLNEDFFTSKRIKKLRKIAGGDTYTIIYLKMQLKSLKSNGVIEYSGIEKTFAEELALDLDEDADNVSVTINYLLSVGLLEEKGCEYTLPYVSLVTGSESSNTQRVRDYRERQKALQCNTNVTEVKQVCNVEKEIDIDIEKDIDKDYIEKEISKEKEHRFIPPTIDEVKAYCIERHNNVDAEKFVDFYQAKGWMIGKNKIKDWKACVRTWEKDKALKQEQKRVYNECEFWGTEVSFGCKKD